MHRRLYRLQECVLRGVNQLKLSLFLLTVPLFISGCLAPSSQATRFYVLTPLADSSAIHIARSTTRAQPISLEIRSLHLPQYLDRPQIVTRAGPNQLTLAEYDQWGGNLRKNMGRTLVKNLSSLLETPDVAMAPRRPPSTVFRYRLDIEVLAYELNAEGTTTLSVLWRLFQGPRREIIQTRLSRYDSDDSQQHSMNGSAELTMQEVGVKQTNLRDYAAIVAAMSRVLAAFSRDVAQEILWHDNPDSRPEPSVEKTQQPPALQPLRRGE
ncbi:MAG: membrane integrity-associated transporter subunit PqiC [Magnetococcales bacterium]|nr:membrane integrity-associated transporter subunit PqiC [Magnetococcales bacterium]